MKKRRGRGGREGEGREGGRGRGEEGLTTGSVTDKMLLYFRDWCSSCRTGREI